MTKIEKAYKKYCKIRYYTILVTYAVKTTVELGFVQFAFKDIRWWTIAVISILSYFCAKWYQLRHMKFRKRGYYKKRRRRVC